MYKGFARVSVGSVDKNEINNLYTSFNVSVFAVLEGDEG